MAEAILSTTRLKLAAQTTVAPEGFRMMWAVMRWPSAEPCPEQPEYIVRRTQYSLGCNIRGMVEV